MSDMSISATRTIDAASEKIFEVLTLPAKHPQIDGSGTVVSGSDQRIQATGDVFVMDMNAPAMGGDYKMENHVTGFDTNKLIAWKPTPVGGKIEENGWEWMWELESQGSDSTQVTVTYSWEHANPKLLQKMSFPVFPESVLEDSLNNLAAAVSGS